MVKLAEKSGISSKLSILIILLVGFLVYLPILRNGFVWDDEEQIVNNPYIKSFTNLPQIFKGSTFASGGAGLTGWYYKPLMSLWFMFNYRLWGLNSIGFHLSQLILHLINCVLIFILFQKLFKEFGDSRARLIGFFLAIVFVVHPANVESVAYISASQELLYTFFLLLAFLIFLVSDRIWVIFSGGLLYFWPYCQKNQRLSACQLSVFIFGKREERKKAFG